MPAAETEPILVRAAIYVRISSAKDDLKMGVKDQERQCRELCAERGWSVTELYSDHGKTAADPDKPRPEYDRLLTDLKRGAVDRVVVAWPDRLHRQLGELDQFVRDANSAGVGFTSVKGGDVNLTDPNAVMMLEILASVANAEVKKNRLKIIDRKRQHVEAGRPSGGWRPFGYEGDGKVRTVRESEAVLVREAVDRVLSGESTYAVAKDWNQRGLRSTRNGQWTPKSVGQVLSNPTIAGLRQHHGAIVGMAQWPAIVERDEWERLQAVLAADHGTKQTKRSSLLRGILVCGGTRDDGTVCGRLLASTGGQVVGGSYGCKRHSHLVAQGRQVGCGLSIAAKFVDDYVTQLVCSVLDTPGLVDIAHADSDADRAEAMAITAANAADEAKLAKWADDFANDALPWSQAEYNRQARKVNDRIAERSTRLADVRSTSVLDTYAGHAAEKWDSLDQDTQRALVFSVIESVTITRAKSRYEGRKSLTPDRFVIHWRYSAIEPLAAQAVSETPAPWTVYETLSKIFPEIAAAWAEAARAVKFPAHVREAMERSKLDIAANPDLSPEQRVVMTESIDAALRQHG
jgi:DNA invertase Pin-like site-specific DNA recombinase